MSFLRICPKCCKEIIYGRKDTFEKAEKNGSQCPSCRTTQNNKSPTRNTKKENNPAWCGYGDVPGKVHSKLKRDAIKRNIDFEITIEDISDQYEDQNKLCAFTGVPLKFGIDASIDRINSDLGYSPDNIQIVHKDLNMMKKDMPNEVFIAWCKLVANHGKEQPMGLPTTQFTQLEHDMDVASPCTGICTLDFMDVCRGCQRTRDEIASWAGLSNGEKQQIIDRIFN